MGNTISNYVFVQALIREDSKLQHHYNTISGNSSSNESTVSENSSSSKVNKLTSEEIKQKKELEYKLRQNINYWI
tara:strand:+ start:1508 stop:1732 length:225 start_codon:yes stop_codon:yes gene_type:complete